MIKKFTLFLFLIISLGAYSQGRVITGKVLDADGNSIPGVTVQVKGTAKGAVTDINGAYQISAEKGTTLKFSYVGYDSQEITIADEQVINVVLKETVNQLNEVVVIGYGTVKKKDLTTAVSVVDDKDMADRKIVSAAQGLQGKAAGVQVMAPSGKPGADMTVHIRGTTSVLASNDPLYVIDGIPTTDIKGLNPNDIQSMSVLKDASAASIYGTRAANGVVIITTFRGSENKPVIKFNTYFGVSQLRKTIDVLNTKEYRTLMNEISPGSLDPSQTGYTNWQDETFGTGTSQSYQLSAAGGGEKSRYYTSLSVLNDQGIVEPAEFNRYTFRTNLDNQLRPWLKVETSLNLIYSKTKDTPDNASSGRGGVIMSSLNTPPFLQIWDPDHPGQYQTNPFQPSWENPIAYMYGPKQSTVDYRFFGNIAAIAKIIEGLNFKTSFGLDYNTHQWDYYLDPYKTNYGRNQNGIGRSDKNNSIGYLWENTLDYTKTFGKHKLTLLGGTSIQESSYNDTYGEGHDYPADTNVTTLNAANTVQVWTTQGGWTMASFFGRAAYDYNNKYYLTISAREDGNSKLYNHWGFFPSFSLAWRISGEKFWNVDIINDLKIRGGWGTTGNVEGIPLYAKYGLWGYARRTPTNPLSGPTQYQLSMGNPDLNWETTYQTNIGFDLSMLNSRIVLNVDAYYKLTEGVILPAGLPSTYPVTVIETNAGTISNKGIEFNVNTVNIDTKLKWNTNFNMSFNKNNVEELKYPGPYYFGKIYSNNQYVSYVNVGQPLGTFYGYVSEGVDPQTGNIVYKDVDGNGIVTTTDRIPIGSGQPDYVFGLTNTFTYWRFDLSIFFQGSYGNEIYNATRIDLEGMFDSKNQSVSVLDRWTPTNRDTDIPKAVSNGNLDNVRNSTRFVEDGSYVRLKALTISYDVFRGNTKLKNAPKLSVYLTGQNLLTFTKYTGFDPEVNAYGNSAVEMGIDYGTYPQAVTIMAGLNLEF